MTNEQYRLNEVERIISDCEIACADEIGDAYGRERAKIAAYEEIKSWLYGKDGIGGGGDSIDLIDREAVWGIIMRSDFVDRFTYQEFTRKLDALPNVTVTPQKSGKWIEKDGFDGDVYYDCSVCGESWTTIEGTPWDNEWKFCPNCGARMESEEQIE